MLLTLFLRLLAPDGSEGAFLDPTAPVEPACWRSAVDSATFFFLLADLFLTFFLLLADDVLPAEDSAFTLEGFDFFFAMLVSDSAMDHAIVEISLNPRRWRLANCRRICLILITATYIMRCNMLINKGIQLLLPAWVRDVKTSDCDSARVRGQT